MTFSVSILGCGAAIPMIHRNPSAQLINVHEKLFLFDCGEGTQVQLRKNRVRLQKINHIFISHLHGDHYFGLIGFITSLHLLGRENDLHLFAHPSLEKIINLHLESSQTILKYSLVFHAIDPGLHEVILDNSDVTVSTLPMNHNFPTCGFLIREKQGKPNIRKDFVAGHDLSKDDFRMIKAGNDFIDADGHVYRHADITSPPAAARAYAYCTDTAYYEPLVPLIRGVDLLYHEATFMDDKEKDAQAKFHSTARQAAMIAKKAEVKKLMLGHYSARYKNLDGLLSEAKDVFTETILADDGLVVEVLNG